MASKVKHHHSQPLVDDLMPKGRALCSYTPQTEDAIALTEGEIVLLLEKVDQKWFMGENSQGQLGNFPIEIIDVITPLP